MSNARVRAATRPKAHRSNREPTLFRGSPLAFVGERNPARVIERTRQGVEASAIDSMARILDLSRKRMLEYAMIPASTAERRIRSGARLSVGESDRLVRIATATQRAVEVFGDETNGKNWMKREVPALGGATPLSLLDTAQGYELVLDTLERIRHGVYA